MMRYLSENLSISVENEMVLDVFDGFDRRARADLAQDRKPDLARDTGQRAAPQGLGGQPDRQVGPGLDLSHGHELPAPIAHGADRDGLQCRKD